MLSCGALERSNNPYIESIVKPCVSKSHKEWVWLRRKWNEKGSMSWKHDLCICAWEKRNSFEMIVIAFKAYSKCKSPIQKKF